MRREDLPHDADIEAAICSGIIVWPEAIGDVASLVDREHFFDSDLGRLFSGLVELHTSGVPLHEVTALTSGLRSMGLMDAIGGVAGIARLVCDGGVHKHHVAYYAHEILRYAELRRIILAAREIESAAMDQRADPSQIAAAGLCRLQGMAATEDKPQRMDEIATGLIEQLSSPEVSHRPIYSGLYRYDNQEGPWLAGEMVTLSAWTSIGKTALAMQIAIHQAEHYRPTLFVSLEMKPPEITTRVMCGRSEVPSSRVRSRNTDDDDRRRLIEAASTLHRKPIFLWQPTRRKTVARISAMAHRFKAEHGLDLLVVDYLQKLHHDGRKTDKRNEEVAAFARGMKDMAVDLDCVVLSVAQLNRESDKAKRMPTLTDLAESGEIEKESDHVLFIHRETREAKDGKLVIAKNRFGRTGKMDITWDPVRQTYTNDEPERLPEFDSWNEREF